MKVTIQQMSSNPANDMLAVYTHNTREVAHIYEDDFAEILSYSQFKRMENGCIVFDVSEQKLMLKSKQYFPYNK